MRHAGDLVRTREQLFVKRAPPLGGLVRVRVQHVAGHHDAAGVEAGVDVRKPPGAANEQCGAHRHEQRQSDFPRGEPVGPAAHRAALGVGA